MKKTLALSLILSVLICGSHLMAQNEVRSESKSARSSKTMQSSTATSARKDPAASATMTTKTADMEGERFFDQTGRAIAAIDKEGTIRDAKGYILGTYTKKGEYLNPYGKKVGSVEGNMIRKADGNIFATIREDGRVYDGKSQYMGTIADDGTILSSRGVRMGSAPGIEKSVVALMYFFPKSTPMPEMKKAATRDNPDNTDNSPKK